MYYGAPVFAGRPDLHVELSRAQRWLSDAKSDDESHVVATTARIGVFSCGPRSINKTVRQVCTTLSPRWRILLDWSFAVDQSADALPSLVFHKVHAAP